MAITIGQQLGSYEVTALLGKGGMGEVYRARDMKLKRDVAIKVLPEEFWRDADRVARFQREAQLLASVHHSNIEASRSSNRSRSLSLLPPVADSACISEHPYESDAGWFSERVCPQ